MLCYYLRIEFYEEETNMSKKRLTISLSEEVFRELEEEAKKAGLNKSAFLTTLIKNQNQRKVS